MYDPFIMTLIGIGLFNIVGLTIALYEELYGDNTMTMDDVAQDVHIVAEYSVEGAYELLDELRVFISDDEYAELMDELICLEIDRPKHRYWCKYRGYIERN